MNTKWEELGLLIEGDSDNEFIIPILEMLSAELESYYVFDKELFDRLLPFSVELYKNGVRHFDINLMLTCIKMEEKNTISLYRQQIDNLIK
jgi:hypothetical protein